MRVIKFRGFHADENGETVIKLDGKEIRGLWLVGDLKQYDGLCWIEEHAVLPETVGQYVCDDKNGKEVFDGDILQNTITDENYILTYNEKEACFAAVQKKSRIERYLNLKRSEDFYVVIGNIFENPELLEVEG